MPEIKTTYRSYLLRLWREDGSGITWRAMLENIAESGERFYFKDLESLTAYILKWQDTTPNDE